ncbi:unnamed protein product [marine sediment metagenome]|uniref:Uncharacterized protein n=1 Tax=marine sediment metagenome TaxID=412755 RepID=X1NHP2_9ZZZZ
MNKIIGLYRERLKGVSTNTVKTLYSNPVPHNMVLFITRFAIYNGDIEARNFEICLCGHGYEHIVDNIVNILSLGYRTSRTMVYLTENERLAIRFSEIAEGKVMEAHITGQWLREEDLMIKVK